MEVIILSFCSVMSYDRYIDVGSRKLNYDHFIKLVRLSLCFTERACQIWFRF